MFRSFLTNTSGGIATLMGVAAIPVTVATGTAVDYSLVAKQDINLQDALDAAVLAGAALWTGTDAERILEAEQVFAADFPLIYQVQPIITVSGNTVTGTASTSVEMAFMGIIGIDNFPIDASASAMTAGQGRACMLALNPDEQDGVRLEGDVALVAENCWVYANSTDNLAMQTNGTSSADADGFCTGGGFSGVGFTPDPIPRCPPMIDPFSYLEAPDDLACDPHQMNTVLNNGSHTLTEGVYCGGIRALAHADVFLMPGVYVIKDGDLELMAHSSFEGDRVVFYFYGSGAYLEIHSGADFNVTAPTEGDYEGFVFVQDAESSAGETSFMAGGENVRIVGMGYFPTQTLDIRGESNFNVDSDFFTLVADKFRIRGNGNIYVHADPNSDEYGELGEVRVGARLLN